VTWKRITEPHQVEEQIMQRNIKHFGQAEDSLFTSEILQNDFSYEGKSKAVELLLDEKYNYENVPKISKGASALLQHLSKGNSLPKMNCEIEFTKFTSALRSWSEGISTLPSGRHLGHYKCLLANDAHDHLYSEENPNPNEMLLMTYYKLATAALRSGISLDRWQNSITTMIKKQAGNPKINKQSNDQ
jgi:hypothetical protein